MTAKRILYLIVLLMISFQSNSVSQVSGQDYFNLSYSASEQHNYDSAMYFISKAIALDTTMSNAYYDRGVLRLSNQDLLGAIDDFSKCLTMDIAHGQAYNNRGYIYIMLGMNEMGCKDFRVGRDLGIEQSKGNFQIYCTDYKEY
jgi:tetratricopeptide (TPR) repeat protein